jgi:hypothetical protein
VTTQIPIFLDPLSACRLGEVGGWGFQKNESGNDRASPTAEAVGDFRSSLRDFGTRTLTSDPGIKIAGYPTDGYREAAKSSQ